MEIDEEYAPAQLNDGDAESVAQEAHRLVFGDRGATYGHPLDDYEKVAYAMTAVLRPYLKDDVHVIPARIAAMTMQGVKQSREVNMPKRDNRTDGCGYWLVVDRIVDELERRGLPLDFPNIRGQG